MAASTARSRVLSDIELEQLHARQQLDRGMLWRLLPLLHPVRRLVLGAVLLELLLVGLTFARPWFVRDVIDHGLVPGSGGATRVDTSVLAFALAGLAIAWASRFVLGGIAQHWSGTAAIRVLNDLRIRVFVHVQHLSISYFDTTKAGRIVSRIDRDVDTLEPLLIQGPPELLSAILRCAIAGALLWSISTRVFASLAAVVPLVLGASWMFRHVSQRNYARVAENRARFTAHLVETVSGVRILQQTVQQEANRHRYRVLLDRFAGSLVRGNISSNWFAPFTAVLTTVGIAVLLLVGAQDIAQGHVSFGELAASLFYVQLFLGPLQELGDLLERYANGAASAQRVFLLLDTDARVVDAPSALVPDAIRGDVEFRGVSFAYDAQSARPVIRALDLSVAAGQVLAIVGPTGHGKSTLVQLLIRFYDVQHGAVLMDGIDVRRLAQRGLRRHVGVVLQDNVLFSGTVLDNLRLVRPEAGDEELIAAAHALGVDEVILRLPRGYDTPVGPLGGHLSHGQRQLVCLVRAFVADPSVLVLDEATSAVDVQTERRLRRALRRLCEGRTAIIIAHRLGTIRDADRIAVIENGQVRESGAHEELLNSDGVYAQLYRSSVRTASTTVLATD